MKLCITGASSYVGARIYYDLQNTYETIGTYHKNRLSPKLHPLDLTDEKATQTFIENHKPNVLIHVANFPNAKNAVENKKQYIALNYESTQTLVDICNRIGCAIVFISGQAALVTDNPYGKNKAKSEEIVKKTTAGYLILRPRLILGQSPNTSNDRTWNRWLHTINSNAKTMTCDSSWRFQPTYIGHLSQMIDQSIQNNWWNITVPVLINHISSQYSIAKDLCEHFGIQVKEKTTSNPFPIMNDDLTLFNQYTLRPNTYKNMINTMINEINIQEKFIL